MLDHELIMEKYSSFNYIVKTWYLIAMYVPELMFITNEMVDYALPSPNLMNDLHVSTGEF